MIKVYNTIGALSLILIFVGFLSPQFYPAIGNWYWLIVAMGCSGAIAFIILRRDLMKELAGMRAMRYGANTVLQSIIFIAIIAIAVAISANHFKQFDMTKTKRYSLTDQTRKVLTNLKKDVKIIGFYQELGGESLAARDTFKRYAEYNSRITFELVDPERKPMIAQKYEIRAYGTIVLLSGDKQEKIYSYAEDKLTPAILSVITEGKKTVYFLKGHGEPDIENEDLDGYSNLKVALEKEQFVVKELELFNSPGVPKDASLVIISGLKNPLFEPEIKDLIRYMLKGGRALIMVEPNGPAEVDAFLALFGIEARNDVIIDMRSRVALGDSFVPMVSEYMRHDITEGFTMASILPIARSLTPTLNPVPGILTAPLAYTSDEAWGETDFEKLETGEADFDKDVDYMGPLAVAMVASIANMDAVEKKEAEATEENKVVLQGGEEEQEDKPKPPRGRIVAFGDSDFVNNNHLEIAGNRDLILNTINWLAEREDLISVRPKKSEIQPLFLSKSQMQLSFMVISVFVPLVALVAGITIVVIRRRRT